MREGWEEVELGEVLNKIVGGGTPSKANDSYWNGNIYWCSVKDMAEESKYLYKTEDTISEEGLKNSSANLIKKGTIITATRMGLGRAFIAGVDMAINQDLKALYPNENIDNIFLLYSILFNKDVIDGLGTGATVKGIKLETLRSIKINLPPLETQKKIASILSGYDDLIENNLKRIKILEEMAQQTYEEWFVRMRFPGHDASRASASLNPETGLPEGWERVKLGDLCEKIFDGTHDSPKPKDSGYKLITGKHLQKGKVDFESAYYISEEDHLKIKKRSGLEKGDIMFSNIGTIGNLSMVTEDFEYSCKNMIVFRPHKDFQYFLYTYFFNENNKNKMISEAAGSTQKFLSLGYIRGFEDLLPPIELIKIFNDFSKNLYLTINNLQNQNQRLREARDILLPRLMMGMIEV